MIPKDFTAKFTSSRALSRSESSVVRQFPRRMSSASFCDKLKRLSSASFCDKLKRLSSASFRDKLKRLSSTSFRDKLKRRVFDLCRAPQHCQAWRCLGAVTAHTKAPVTKPCPTQNKQTKKWKLKFIVFSVEFSTFHGKAISKLVCLHKNKKKKWKPFWRKMKIHMLIWKLLCCQPHTCRHSWRQRRQKARKTTKFQFFKNEIQRKISWFDQFWSNFDQKTLLYCLFKSLELFELSNRMKAQKRGFKMRIFPFSCFLEHSFLKRGKFPKVQLISIWKVQKDEGKFDFCIFVM